MENLIGIVYRNEEKDYVCFAICEKNEQGRIVFYTIASKEAKIKKMTESAVMELHGLLKGAGSYKDSDTMGVKTFYVGEENLKFIDQYLGTGMAPKV